MDEKYMRIALKQALKSFDQGDVPIGAVIVKKGEVISVGYNCKEIEGNAIRHAEIIAIDAACKIIGEWRLEECVLYTTLEPCLMCTGAIVQARIPKVIYGAKSDKFGFMEIVSNSLQHEKNNHRVEVLSGILEYECQSILKTFFENKRQ